ncbi:MAG: class I SAM-dependent methyltransferase [Clostridia bacterium]|nr:class I SAM-dependent methyltransferase [Clostridia bacterium]MBP5269504.1 class I SAM-dependent methyltransferase [Clostridia bacterium]
MIDLLNLHKQFILTHLREGDVCADFTMGNGHDTEFLSKTVGPSGKVYAFDVQPQAVASTEKNLKAAGCPENYILINDSHHRAGEYIKEKIRAGMFNLGWLPGGDKSITTMRETTLPAVDTAIGLLGADSVLTVAVYPGHPEGDAEGTELRRYLSGLSRFKVCVTEIRIANSPSSPYFFLIETK